MLKVQVKWRQSVGTIVFIGALIVWIRCGAAILLAVIDGLPQHIAVAAILVTVLALVTAIGGLVIFWLVAAEIDFWRSGYRIRQLGRKEYISWTPGPKDYIYEERACDGRIQRMPFVRVVLEDGYPAPSEVLLPNEEVWDARVPSWAIGRRAEIVERMIECCGGSAARIGSAA